MDSELYEYSIVGYFNVIVTAKNEEEAINEIWFMQLDQLDKVDIDDISSA